MTTSNDTPEEPLDHALQQWANAQRTAASDPAFVRHTMARLHRRRRSRLGIAWGVALAAAAVIATHPGAQALVEGWAWMQQASAGRGQVWLVPAAVFGLSWLLAVCGDSEVPG